MEKKELTMDLAGRTFKLSNGPFSTYASGYAIVSLGDTVIMANASMTEKGRDDADFFPMVVDYEENMYAAGKIKGSRFIKREGRPSENAILISRLIDRPVRPLFPKGITNEVQIICSALSADLEVDPGTTAMNAASLALLMSGAPFEGPIGSVRVGYVNDELILNPTYKQVEEGKMDLVVAGTLDAITMVEAAMKEVPEDVVLQALEFAHKYIKEICEFQKKYVAQFEIPRLEPTLNLGNEAAQEAVSDFINSEKSLLDTVQGLTKKDVKAKVHLIEDQLLEKYAAEIAEGKFTNHDLAEVLNSFLEKNMREKILGQGLRLDGRALDAIRPIRIELDVLPRTHGSAIFQRGETTALTITTLGGPGDAQIVDTMEADKVKKYFHHYHFPPYATGEVKPLRGPSRREIGHGDLAERALIPVLPAEKDFAYTMWLVSEIVQCNGSSSMASVCGSSLSLMAAGVPIKKPVAGIAMGLVTDPESGKYQILTDIQGMEDFAGDMDFKVAGSPDGITALQMDIKVKGLSLELMRNALEQSKKGRMEILAKMNEAIAAPRSKLSQYAPLIMTMNIDPDMIRVVIGKGGETIQKIVAETGVEIDINDDGLVTITAPQQENGLKAVEWVKRLTYVPKVNDIFDGKVVKIMEFGAFVEFMPGKDGLLHISELANERIGHVEDVVKLGDSIKVKLIKIDPEGRYSLSHKALLNVPGPVGHEHPHSVNTSGSGKMGATGEQVDGTANVRKV